MEWLVWVAVAVVGVPIAWFLFKVLLGASVSPHVTGKLLLKKELQKYGVDPAKLGDACLSEIADSAVRVADAVKGIGGKSFSTALVDHIEGSAVRVTMYLDGEKPRDGDPVYEALKRHGVLR